MKLLLCTGFLPPYAPSSAVRVSKFAAFLLARGHDVRLLGALNQQYPPVVAAEFPEERALYVPYTDVRDVLGRLRPSRERSKPSAEVRPRPSKPGPASDAAPASAVQKLKTNVRALYQTSFALPDNLRLWQRPAVQAALQAWQDWRPDLIYVSAPPHSAIGVGADLAAHWSVPWVLEYRDLWTEHPYYGEPFWRRAVERRLEARWTQSVAGYVTVTRTWANWLKRRGKPVILAMNGFDPADYACPMPPDTDPRTLSLIYAGALYGAKRDPSPLFQAIADLGPDKTRLRVRFHTPGPNEVASLAARYGLEDPVVQSLPPVPRQKILELEQRSSLLLLLRWDDPREDSVIAGKLFEYIGARRPILSIGRTRGEAADLIVENKLGVVCGSAPDAGALLRQALDQGADAAVGYAPAAAVGFARESQCVAIEQFFAELV